MNVYAYHLMHNVRGCRIAKIGKSNIHPMAIIREGEYVTIGDNCLINHNCLIQAGKSPAGYIKIGNSVHTGVNVMMMAIPHCFYTREISTKEQDYLETPIIINDDVWIGAGSIILSGVTIGKGAIIHGDYKGLAEQIRDALRNKDILLKKGESGRRFFEFHFTKENCISNLCRIINDKR